ncbi:MAG: hypothetical protein ACRD21_11135 [Vicinamibacteria bacterium]
MSYWAMLARPHLSIAGNRRTYMARPDSSLLHGVVAPEVIDAMRVASEALKRAGVRHVVVGGLAVGAHGFPRATKDVDFLVGDEAFERHAGGLVTLRAGVPFQVNQVAVDFLSAEPGESFLAAALEAEPGSTIDGPPLVYLKLKSPRHKDRTDVIELVKAGLDVNGCREYLSAHAPSFVAPFEDAVERARAEDE